MGTIFISIIILLAGFFIAAVALPDIKQRNSKPVSRAKLRTGVRLLSIVIAIVFFFCFGCIATVSTGYTGIVTKFNQVQDYTYEAGLHFKSPFIKVIEMDNREQRAPFNLAAFSSDIQEVTVTGSVNYSIDKTTAMQLYREVGTNYVNILVTPRVPEVLKSCFAKYTAEELIENRQNLSNEVCTSLKEDLESHGINIISVSIEDVDFSDSYTDSIEQKQVATQNKLRAQTEQEQQTMEAQQAAERKKIAAEAEAEVARIQADAEAYALEVKAAAEANANKQIGESLTPNLIEYTQINRWNGQLPTYMGADNPIPIIDLN